MQGGGMGNGRGASGASGGWQREYNVTPSDYAQYAAAANWGWGVGLRAEKGLATDVGAVAGASAVLSSSRVTLFGDTVSWLKF